MRGRPIPHVSTALVLKNFPTGFAEFVCCVGQMKPDKFKETSGETSLLLLLLLLLLLRLPLFVLLGSGGFFVRPLPPLSP